uniref:Uncharacterized protein n=1 Tax=uncultured crenarchaeote MCG TaxID=529375 RepID=B2YI75_9CREN|nr:unknown [uncultured crenarchaeote MCG]
MEYTCIADLSNGLIIANAAPYVSGKWNEIELLRVKADDVGNINEEMTAISILFFGSEVYNTKVPGFKPSAPKHIFKVNYINGTYSLYADGVFVAEKQSFEKPNAIVLGNANQAGNPVSAGSWEQWGYWGWSSFKVDHIRVVLR